MAFKEITASRNHEITGPPRRRRRRKKRGPGQSGAWTASPYTAMLADPCGSTLVPGFWGTSEGLLARARSTITFTGSGTGTSGYILWSPDYFSVGAVGTPLVDTPANLFAWNAVSPATQPINVSPTASYGDHFMSDFENGSVMSTAASGSDPAYGILEDDIVQDARPISACVSITYTGTMANASGQIGFIDNFPLESLLSGGVGDNPPSVDELFRYTSKTSRLGVDTLEIVSRVNDSGHFFRDENDSPVLVNPGGLTNPATVTPLGAAQQPRFFGFCWRGLDAAASNPLVFELTKNFEWRAAPRSGFAAAPPVTYFDSPPAHDVQRRLDAKVPGWDSGRSPGPDDGATRIAKLGYTGTGGGKLRGAHGLGGLLANLFDPSRGMDRFEKGLNLFDRGVGLAARAGFKFGGKMP